MEQSKITEWEVVDNFGILTINNPPQNFLTEPEIVSLSDLQRWTSNETLRGLIVQGKGRHFSAGADKNNILTAPDEEGIRNNLTKGKKVLDYLWDLPIPTIAAIRGVCFGGGLEVALSCHIRICSDKALFSFPETGLGIMPGLHGTVKASAYSWNCQCNRYPPDRQNHGCPGGPEIEAGRLCRACK